MPTRGSLFSLSVKRPMSENRLLRHHEVAAAVRLPALLVVLGAEGLFLAIADGVQAVGGNPQRNEVLLYRIRAAVAKREVVLGRAALVAVAFNRHLHLRIVAQEVGGLAERSPASARI